MVSKLEMLFSCLVIISFTNKFKKFRSLSRDDIIDLEPLYEDTTGHCSRAARVTVSKSCVPPGSVIILAEEVNTGEVSTKLNLAPNHNLH